jgi:hypothetical protein
VREISAEPVLAAEQTALLAVHRFAPEWNLLDLLAASGQINPSGAVEPLPYPGMCGVRDAGPGARLAGALGDRRMSARAPRSRKPKTTPRPPLTPAVAQIHQLVARVFGPVEVVQIIRRQPEGDGGRGPSAEEMLS